MAQPDRYHRQAILPEIGPDGQARIRAGKVLIVGCGALGTHLADHIVRAGVGLVRIVDRDVVEWTNLQRQTLYEERDVLDGLPKAIAARDRLSRVNSDVQIQARIEDVNSSNVEDLLDGIDLVLDGTDNVATRYLLNDACVKHGRPWVYGACVGTQGRVMGIPVGRHCLRCVFPEAPSPGELPTCDTAGVLGPIASITASLQATLALKFLMGQEIRPELVTLDVWENRFKSISLEGAQRPDCPCCRQRNFEYLDRLDAGEATLCGRNAIQVRPGQKVQLDLQKLSKTLAPFGEVSASPYLVKAKLTEPAGMELTVFPDGRAVVQGTTDVSRARSIYARYVGA